MIRTIHNFIIRILAGFILTSKKRKEFRSKYAHAHACVRANKSNTINIPKNRNIKIHIVGKNNVVNIDKDLHIDSPINIFIVGDNNIVNIDKANLKLSLNMGYHDGREVYNSKFHFGKSYSGTINALVIENGSSINIADNCMISNNIEIRCSDDHTVLDLEGNVVNKAKDITIGNHVWLCKDVLILKNSTIPDNCIVGAKSVVAKRFDTPNCAICGNPAKVVKTGINWDGARPDLYNNKSTEPETLVAVESNPSI